MNGDIAAHSIPTASHGRKMSQLIDIIVRAVEADSKIMPYNGCCGFGSNIAKNGISPRTIFINSVVQMVAKNMKIHPIKRKAHECSFRS